MKKLLLVALSFITYFCMSDESEVFDPSVNFRLMDKYPYNGITDPRILKMYPDFDFLRNQRNTTFGRMAKLSDVIGIGNLVQWNWSNLVIKIETPLFGCTNGQIIVIDSNNGFPYFTNTAQRIFCVFTNQYTEIKAGYIDWIEDPKTNEHTRVFNMFQFDDGFRASWFTNEDDGLVLEQFTNVLQAVRFDRNWTNFYYLCRDGLDSPSVRVAEDSFYDLCGLIKFSSKKEAHFIYNDPLLVSSEAKAYLFKRFPHIKEEE